MSSDQFTSDPMHRIPMERWQEVETVFKEDWPRGIPAYKLLEAQRSIANAGIDFKFSVYRPFGDARNGILTIIDNDYSYEMTIQCPRNDTSILEDALKNTNVIDWSRNITLTFVPCHVTDCMKKIAKDVNIEFCKSIPSESFYLPKSAPRYDNFIIPSDIKFGLLTIEHAELVDSMWPHKYPGSVSYHNFLISNNSGYALFKDGTPVTWVFINEAGNLGHMFTLEEHRRKSYAEVIMKLVCNKLLDEGKNVTVYCVLGNVGAGKLYRKLGFTVYDVGISWCWFKPVNKKKNNVTSCL